MEMPKANESHRKLEALAGTWTGDETIHPSHWDPNGGPARGTFENRLDLDGFFLINDYVETRDGKVTYRGHGVYGWDDKERCYTMYWYDSMGGGGYAIPARGTWEGNTLTFEHKTPMGYARYIYDIGDGALAVDFWRDPDSFTGYGNSGGRINVYLEVIDEDGNALDRTTAPEIVFSRDLSNGTTDEIPIDDKPDNEFQTNFPMTGGGPRYGASVMGASDKVVNLRLPVNHHVTYVLVFQRRAAR